ncbi:MAG: hypothetical protein M0Z66_07810 [Thermaerobacter sp.]|nr:hypothetical protein [Thermaerobacter sp.]
MLGRLSPGQQAGGVFALLLALLVLTVRAVPATPYYERFLPWIVARGVGLTALVLLTVLVSLGILLSHPLNRSVWRQTKELLVWHRYLWTFVIALIAVHVVAILLDRYAHVSLFGALVPGLSGYRALPVALGTISLYALLLTAASAAYAKLLPAGLWLGIHRWGALVFALSWAHALLTGTDSLALRPFYLFLLAVVAVSAAVRYWMAVPRPQAPQARKGDSPS